MNIGSSDRISPKGEATTTPAANPINPSEKALTSIAEILVKQLEKSERDKKYASVKYIVSLLGTGAILSAAILLPKSARILKELMTLSEEAPEWERWKYFNTSYLQRTLRNLQKQKIVEMVEENGREVVCLTALGRRKILRYSIETISIDRPKSWDRCWRLVLYDVPRARKNLGDDIRRTLQRLGFYKLQESVYIYPYPCFAHVEYLREYYNLGDSVQYMVVNTIENDSAYKTFFALS